MAGISMFAGQPSTQYLHPVQGMAPAARSMSAALVSKACSAFDKGCIRLNRSTFSSSCWKVDMPERTMATPGSPATNRNAQEAKDALGSASFSSGAHTAFSDARLPPRIGSMTMTGLPCFCATS